MLWFANHPFHSSQRCLMGLRTGVCAVKFFHTKLDKLLTVHMTLWGAFQHKFPIPSPDSFSQKCPTVDKRVARFTSVFCFATKGFFLLRDTEQLIGPPLFSLSSVGLSVPLRQWPGPLWVPEYHGPALILFT